MFSDELEPLKMSGKMRTISIDASEDGDVLRMECPDCGVLKLHDRFGDYWECRDCGCLSNDGN